MSTRLQPRVSTPYWQLNADSATQHPHRGALRGFYASMLVEDISNLHYAYDIGLEYDCTDREVGDKMINCLLRELDRNHRKDTTQLILKLVSVVALDHLKYGRCAFELFEDTDSGNTAPRLGLIPGWSLKRHRNRTFQATPAAGILKWRRIPTAALAEFRLPGRLGKDLYRTSKSLQALDVFRPGDPDMVIQARSTGYDFSTHRHAFDELSARTTRIIGWDGRGLFMDRATNSYKTYRQLRFRHTWLTIFSATVETLNHICTHPALAAKCQVKLHVTGLPAIEEVDRNMDAVINGSESLDSIFRNVLHPRD